MNIVDMRGAIKAQYHASLEMLRQAIDRCPEELWTADGHPSQYWQIAYHALFFAHLYLQAGEDAFIPWEHHREEYQFLENVPWPPHSRPKIGQPYTRAEVLEYWKICDGMVDACVDSLDLDAPQCGFWWYDMPKLEHQMMNARHIQHHVGQLEDRLRLAGGSVGWVGTVD
jgi:hypothetical protein